LAAILGEFDFGKSGMGCQRGRLCSVSPQIGSLCRWKIVVLLVPLLQNLPGTTGRP